MVITASNDRGVLYGAFALLRKIALGESDRQAEREAVALRPRALGQRVEQSGWHHRARLRRPLHLLGQPAGPRRSLPRRRVWPPARIARHQRAAPSTTSMPTRACSLPISFRKWSRIAEAFRPWGVRVAIVRRFRQPQDPRRTRHLRPARAQSRSLVEGPRRRALHRHPRSRRLRAEGRFRRPRRPRHLRPHPRRRRQCAGARPASRTAACCSTAASSTTITSIGTIRRTIAAAPPTTTSSRSMASSTTT